MEGALIGVACFGIAGPEGEVEGAAHLFVVENLAGGLGDGAVGSEGNLADSAGAHILVEHGDQEILAFFGGDLGSATFFHDDPCVPNGVALVNTAVIEKNHALRAAIARSARAQRLEGEQPASGDDDDATTAATAAAAAAAAKDGSAEQKQLKKKKKKSRFLRRTRSATRADEKSTDTSALTSTATATATAAAAAETASEEPLARGKGGAGASVTARRLRAGALDDDNVEDDEEDDD